MTVAAHPTAGCRHEARRNPARAASDGGQEADPALMMGVLSREFWEEIPDLSAGDPKKASVRRDTHEDHVRGINHLARPRC